MSDGKSCPICGSSDTAPAFSVKGREYLKCAGCGIVFRGRIDAGDAKALYQSDSYQKVQSEHHLDLRESVYFENLDAIEKKMKSGRILDVGCGEGQFLNLAAKRGWKTFGVEISPMAVRRAKEAFNLDIVAVELREARFPDSHFDVVTLFNVLDHLPFPVEALKEIHRVLKPGGLLVVRVPNGVFHVNLIRAMTFLEPQLVFHLYCFTPGTVRSLLKTAGFEDIRITNSAPTPYDPYSVSPALGNGGMQAIKKAVYGIAQAMFYLSAGALVAGPSMSIFAEKGTTTGVANGPSRD